MIIKGTEVYKETVKVILPPSIKKRGIICAGVDVGSQSTDVALVNDEGEVLSYSIKLTGYNGEKTARESLNECLEKARIKFEEIASIVSTGYGRNRVSFANEQVTEITCHARGALSFFPNTRSVIDIGGQDSKAIRLDHNGKVIDFAMNDKCAAGTGRFLENMARVLELDIEEMVNLGLKSKSEIKISSLCTVFAESEVISLIHQGKAIEDIINGLFKAIASRVAPLLKRLGVVEEVTMTGGVAKNKGVVQAMERELGKKINIPPEPQIIGAIGAAIVAMTKIA